MSEKMEAIERVHRALEEIRKGRMVIVVDDEDRENEGDLCMAADAVTPEAINFMARFGRGLICLALTEERVKRLELPMMVDENRSPRTTAFTVSIEAREGVTTGISAADRARTVQVAVAPDARPVDLVSPGHIFPLKARPGGVLQRTGHTEGSVDLARLAGFSPAGVICEIMNDDGTMARMPDLVRFGEQHGLAILSIADLIQYRLQTERLMRRTASEALVLPSGHTWMAHTFRSLLDDRQFLALVHGQPAGSSTLVRMHTGSVLGDVFGVRARGHVVMDDVIRRIEAEGEGVIVFIPPAEVDLLTDLRSYTTSLKEGGRTSRARDQGEVLREYGLGAQILAELGLTGIRLLTNRPRRVVGLDGFGLEIVEQLPTSESEAMSVRSAEGESLIVSMLDEAESPTHH